MLLIQLVNAEGIFVAMVVENALCTAELLQKANNLSSEFVS